MTKIAKAGCLSVGILIAGWGMVRADSETATPPKPGVLNAAAARVTATVDSIDYTTRMISLKTPDGNVQSMEVGPGVTRFNEIKKGDLIQVDYLESVVVVVQDPHETISSAEGSSTVLVRNKGKSPSGTMVQTDVVTATVVKINAKKRKATLRGPDGNVQEVDIAPDVPHLENVKKGDQVLIKYTRSLAMAVHKPQ